MTRRAVPAVVLVPLLVVALVVSSSACGTVMNFADKGPPWPYGGVAADLQIAALYDPVHSPEKIVYAPIVLLDMGLSAVFDTATLPLVAWIQVRHLLEMSPPQGPPPVSGPLLRPAK